MTLSMVLTLMSALACGVLLGAACVVLGAWMAFRVRRVPGEGQGFLMDPKGEVFSIRDDTRLPCFPGTEEPGKAEKAVMDRSEQFLKAMGERL